MVKLLHFKIQDVSFIEWALDSLRHFDSIASLSQPRAPFIRCCYRNAQLYGLILNIIAAFHCLKGRGTEQHRISKTNSHHELSLTADLVNATWSRNKYSSFQRSFIFALDNLKFCITKIARRVKVHPTSGNSLFPYVEMRNDTMYLSLPLLLEVQISTSTDDIKCSSFREIT